MLLNRLQVKCILSLVRNTHSAAAQKKKPFRVLSSKLDLEESPAAQGIQNYQKCIASYEKLKQMCLQGGGEKAVQRHTQMHKKMLPRQRLKMLLDPGSEFLEIGLFAGLDMLYGNIPAAGNISGIGQIHDTYCVISLNDATVKGGTFFPISVTKCLRLQEIAHCNLLPVIYLIDSGGAFLPLQADIFPDKLHGGRTFFNQAIMSSAGVPQVTVVCGSCTAGAAYTPTMSEEAIIVKGIGTVFLGGPPLVKAATGEVVTSEDLGGADLHCRLSGCTDYSAETEDEALEMCRDVVASLNIPALPAVNEFDEPLYSSSHLNALSGIAVWQKEHVYDVLSRILDGSRFKEFKQLFGENLVLGFGHIEGTLVGIFINCGPVTSHDALKGCHFIQICDQRDVPMIFLQSSPHQLETGDSSQGQVLKDRSKMAAALATAQVPKISINLLGCHADGNLTMCGPSFGPNLHFMWPLACFTPIGMSAAAVDSEFSETNSLPLEDFPQNSSMFAASHMLTDGVILPQDTRKVLSSSLRMVMQGRTSMSRRLPVLRM